MSRVEHSNDKFMVAFGADELTGSFVQIWAQPLDDQDTSLVAIDNMGVRTISDIFKLPESALKYINSISSRFDYARENGNQHPNIDHTTVTQLLNMLGFHNMGAEVKRTFD